MFRAPCICGWGFTSHERARSGCSRYRPAWRTETGVWVEITKMTDSHLKNTIRLIERRSVQPVIGYSELVEERDSRVRATLSGLGD